MRGEDEAVINTIVARPESPPHARGRPKFVDDDGKDVGITPACAGKTSTSHTRSVRGRGSPPHARGRRLVGPHHARTRRITPACAGKTPGGRFEGCVDWDHPRMRGEDESIRSYE